MYYGQQLYRSPCAHCPKIYTGITITLNSQLARSVYSLFVWNTKTIRRKIWRQWPMFCCAGTIYFMYCCISSSMGCTHHLTSTLSSTLFGLNALHLMLTLLSEVGARYNNNRICLLNLHFRRQMKLTTPVLSPSSPTRTFSIPFPPHPHFRLAIW